MRGLAPERLTSLLARLNLATPDRVQSMRARVRRLASEFPDFESVWVDALAQARILTPYQAAEINAGRGEDLACGDYVIAGPSASPEYAACFAARHLETGREVSLYLVRKVQGKPLAAAERLEELVAQLAPLARRYPGILETGGIWHGGLWAVCERIEGVSAAAWLAHNGRLPTEAVLAIARDMTQLLAVLEAQGIAHGDLGAAGMLFRPGGGLAMPMPGLRGIVRPSEGYSFNDLSCEAYDYLAPERITRGSPPTIASDIYACGALWWQLLTGRTPFAGGKSLAKLKSVHAARWVDVRQLAPHTPERLASAIARCTMRDPAARPPSFQALGAELGPAARGDGRSLAQALRESPWHFQPRPAVRGTARRVAKVAGLTAVSLALALLGARFAWIRGTPGNQPPQKTILARAAGAPAVPHDGPTAAAEAAAPAAPRSDNLVVPAMAIEMASEPLESSERHELVLSTEGPIDAASLQLSPGMCVRGAEGERPQVMIDGAGIPIDCDDVSFENIDFVWKTADERTLPGRPGALFRLRAASATWRGCTFSAQGSMAPIVVVVEPDQSGQPPAFASLALVDCVIQNVAAIVDGAASVSLANTLCVSTGPIVRISQGAATSGAISLALEHVTIRGDGGVLQWRYTRLPREAAAITVTVNDCVLDVNDPGALVTFAGRDKPDQLLTSIAWNGQGSIVTPRTTIALWRSSERASQPLADDALEIAGLVRGTIEFSGKADGLPSGSRVTRWQGALRSDDPPGINAALLPRVRR